MKINFLEFFFLILFSIKTVCMPEPYNSIMALPLDEGDSMFASPNKRILDAFIREKKPGIIVEIGTWLGNSAIFMASKMTLKGAKLYAIDHWLGSKEHQEISEYAVKLKNLYKQFLSNVIHRGLTHKIIPVKMASLEAAELLDIQPDLIYVDGSHEEKDVFNDIMAWYPKLRIGGIMCGDDFTWYKPETGSIQRAVERAAQLIDTPIHVEVDFWYFDPKK